LQLSATSQPPAEPRHAPLLAKALVGQLVELPSQTSATSHIPAASRHGVPALAGRNGAPHTGLPELHDTVPIEQGLAVGQSAPGVHVLLQTPIPSQKPTEQPVPSETNASIGQSALPPLHDSATSHVPAAARHTPPGANVSTGQVGLEPSQTSSTSQPPAAARHPVPAGWPAQGTAEQLAAQVPEQHISLSAQRADRTQASSKHSAFSQGPATQVAAEQAPETQPVVASAAPSLGAQRGPTPVVHAASFGVLSQRVETQRSIVQEKPSSQSASPSQLPASMRTTLPSPATGIGKQPAPGWQYSPAGQLVGAEPSRHTPLTHTGRTHDVVLLQSSSSLHSLTHSSLPSAPHSGSTQVPPRHSVAAALSPAPGQLTPRQSRVSTASTTRLPSSRMT